MAACPPLSSDEAFLSSLLGHIDCQAQTIGAVGYQALAAPGSPVALAVTGVLTIFIALFGLRMVLGATPSLSDGVQAVVKIGVVLLIATSWPAFRTVAYDLVVQGPGQLAAAINGPSGLPGASGDLAARLQRVDVAIVRLTTLGSGRADLTSQSLVRPDGTRTAEQRAPISDDLAFGSARVAFLSGTIATYAVVRLGAGVLLALAPLFAGLLLFDLGRSLFFGWVRALAFTFVASIAFTVILAVELTLLEPWLSSLLQLRSARIVTPQAPIELLILSLAFAAAHAGAFALILRLAFTPHLQPGSRRLAATDGSAGAEARNARTRSPGRDSGPARAVALAHSIAAAQRRETTASIQRLSRGIQPARTTGDFLAPTGRAGSSTASALRRAKPRQSLSSALRDRKA